MLRSFILFAGLVLALGLAGCPQQAEEPAGDAEVTEEVVVEEVPAEAPSDEGSMEEAPADDSGSMEEAPADSGDGSSSEDGSGDDSM